MSSFLGIGCHYRTTIGRSRNTIFWVSGQNPVGQILIHCTCHLHYEPLSKNHLASQWYINITRCSGTQSCLNQLSLRSLLRYLLNEVLPWPDNFVSFCTTVQPCHTSQLCSWMSSLYLAPPWYIHITRRSSTKFWLKQLLLEEPTIGLAKPFLGSLGTVQWVNYRSIVYAIWIRNLYQRII